MKNALIVLTALAGLFTQSTQAQTVFSPCKPNTKYCGRKLNDDDCSKIVVQQWNFDRGSTVSTAEIVDTLFNCKEGGIIEYIDTCKYGCVVTDPGVDDYCNDPCECCKACDQTKCKCTPADAAQTKVGWL